MNGSPHPACKHEGTTAAAVCTFRSNEGIVYRLRGIVR